jgi:hypothetical protein
MGRKWNPNKTDTKELYPTVPRETYLQRNKQLSKQKLETLMGKREAADQRIESNVNNQAMLALRMQKQ